MPVEIVTPPTGFVSDRTTGVGAKNKLGFDATGRPTDSLAKATAREFSGAPRPAFGARTTTRGAPAASYNVFMLTGLAMVRVGVSVTACRAGAGWEPSVAPVLAAVSMPAATAAVNMVRAIT
ncbi:hypothetical protein ABQF26_06985, partial [Mycolicibacterium elephantis]